MHRLCKVLGGSQSGYFAWNDRPASRRQREDMVLLDSELVWCTVFHTRDQAENAIARYIDDFYNPIRRHSALDFLSPAQFEKWPHPETMPLHFYGAKSMRLVRV